MFPRANLKRVNDTGPCGPPSPDQHEKCVKQIAELEKALQQITSERNHLLKEKLRSSYGVTELFSSRSDFSDRDSLVQKITELETNLQKIKEEKDALVKALEESYLQKLGDLNSLREAELLQLNQKFVAEKEILIAKLAESETRYGQQLTEKDLMVQKLMSSHCEKIEELNRQHEEQVTKLEQEKAELVSKNKRLSNNLDEVVASKEVEVADLRLALGKEKKIRQAAEKKLAEAGVSRKFNPDNALKVPTSATSATPVAASATATPTTVKARKVLSQIPSENTALQASKTPKSKGSIQTSATYKVSKVKPKSGVLFFIGMDDIEAAQANIEEEKRKQREARRQRANFTAFDVDFGEPSNTKRTQANKENNPF